MVKEFVDRNELLSEIPCRTVSYRQLRLVFVPYDYDEEDNSITKVQFKYKKLSKLRIIPRKSVYIFTSA